MATLHIIFDPTDRIQVPRFDQGRPNGMCAISMSVPEMVDDPAEIEALAKRLSTMLLEQMKVET